MAWFSTRRRNRYPRSRAGFWVAQRLILTLCPRWSALPSTVHDPLLLLCMAWGWEVRSSWTPPLLGCSRPIRSFPAPTILHLQPDMRPSYPQKCWNTYWVRNAQATIWKYMRPLGNRSQSAFHMWLYQAQYLTSAMPRKYPLNAQNLFELRRKSWYRHGLWWRASINVRFIHCRQLPGWFTK